MLTNTTFLRNKGFVSLTFDDALSEHLDQAVPVLNEHGMSGTFYVHLAAESFTQRFEEWQDAARRGHELGNHTIFHPADSRKAWVRDGNAIDNYTLDRMRQELEVANRLLQAVDGQTQRTFAYPCSNSVLGRRGIGKRLLFKLGYERTRLPGLVDRWALDIGSTQQSYIPVVRDLVFAARGGGLEKESQVPAAASIDRFMLPSVAVAGWSFRELVEFTERGIANGRWVIFQFHGIGGGHRLNCESSVFQEFVAWLHANSRCQVATVRQVATQLWSQLEVKPFVAEPTCPT